MTQGPPGAWGPGSSRRTPRRPFHSAPVTTSSQAALSANLHTHSFLKAHGAADSRVSFQGCDSKLSHLSAGPQTPPTPSLVRPPAVTPASVPLSLLLAKDSTGPVTRETRDDPPPPSRLRAGRLGCTTAVTAGDSDRGNQRPNHTLSYRF